MPGWGLDDSLVAQQGVDLIDGALRELQLHAEPAPQFTNHGFADEQFVLDEHVGEQVRAQSPRGERSEHHVRRGRQPGGAAGLATSALELSFYGR